MFTKCSDKNITEKKKKLTSEIIQSVSNIVGPYTNTHTNQPEGLNSWAAFEDLAIRFCQFGFIVQQWCKVLSAQSRRTFYCILLLLFGHMMMKMPDCSKQIIENILGVLWSCTLFKRTEKQKWIKFGCSVNRREREREMYRKSCIVLWLR